MTKTRQSARAKRRKLARRNLKLIPMSAVHGYVNGVEQPIQYWDGQKIQFKVPPPEGAIVTIKIDVTKKVMEGVKCL